MGGEAISRAAKQSRVMCRSESCGDVDSISYACVQSWQCASARRYDKNYLKPWQYLSVCLEYTVRDVALMLIACNCLKSFLLCVLHTVEVLVQSETKSHSASWFSGLNMLGTCDVPSVEAS